MRGKRPMNAEYIPHVRITPADAGKTGGCSHNSRAHEDHPRGCGENRDVAVSVAVKQGSPPRMRGKRCQDRKQNRRSRITPADAGKTLLSSRLRF